MRDAARKILHELVDRLPADKVSKVRRVLEEEVESTEQPAQTAESFYDAARDLIGSVEGPADLSVSPEHMRGYGE